MIFDQYDELPVLDAPPCGCAECNGAPAEPDDGPLWQPRPVRTVYLPGDGPGGDR